MKRIVPLLLALLLLLFGCAEAATPSNATTANTTTIATTTAATAATTEATTTMATTAEPLAEPLRIAVIDTGISSAAIASEFVAEGANYLIADGTTEDTYGHGTAVASVILANASDVVLIPLVSNVYDRGKISFVDNDTYAQMIRDAVDLYHCAIINVSAGLVLDKASIRAAVEYAEQQGVLVVASVGNDYVENPGQTYYPAAYESVLAVGSLTADGTQISEFSQRGSWVDLFAVGEDVPILTLSGAERTESGSSFAAARVSAVAATYWRANPELTVAELRALLIAEAEDYGAKAN